MTCLGFSVWWRYRAQWWPLRQFEGTVHGAHGKPLQIAGKTQHLDLQWGEARGRACFIVIVGLELPPCLIGMDIMRPLRVHIDVTNGTATPAQPDPQTVHLNAAHSQQRQRKIPSPEIGLPPWEPPVRLKVSSNERKYRCQKLTCQSWEPLVHLKPSHSERKCRCQKLARQPWEPPLRPDFRSNERKCRCQK